ncbi:leucine zipper putative tumor suppressor 2 [Rhinatrema bivittatum]|uniref:leucine zipper putative tumor suppressor 2 n=1 Tax=Rhinatrema bivittatum TaxID=194408 RepID=UPI0011260FFD|nr:leucine zipper putative tumor suppressor 2 [Rhinatrema bivittatum]XP_029466111.1 leucine zipper putative tumor suppressor 2 [Rhinatrema bivittatum]XP_029466112.1 leucine zipper putative tumor suppressor 2 [Rhinatrema bivittatum]XP_029466113.1 leucine zipper putative tumor suppressor 2 [Rhinatrema bivittatum]
MAIVQTFPLSIEQPPEVVGTHPHSSTRSPSVQTTMGSVSSLISGRPYLDKQCKTAEFGVKCRKSAQVPNFFRQQDRLLKNGCSSQDPLVHGLPSKKPCSVSGGNGNYAYVNEDSKREWNESTSPSSPCSDTEDVQEERSLNGNIKGPPPKLIPVSGKLEKNIEKTLIRPTAFKPVVPKNRNSSLQYLVARPGVASVSESRRSLSLLFGGSSAGSTEKQSSFSCRNSTHSGTMSDSGRNSLSSLPTYSTSCSHQLEPVSASMGHINLDGHGNANGFPDGSSRGLAGPSNSDSGRSSSSKSTGSLNGRGNPSSDSGSPVNSEEVLIRELEEKLRERETELLQLRENLDENEAAICQVYEEKQRRCEQEMEELQQNYTVKMKQAAQKAQRLQQVLQLQIFQLQQEKKKLQEDFSHLLQERELLEKKCASFEREQTELGPRLEETKWEVCQKSGEISLLKQQLKDAQAELAQKGSEMLLLRAQLREARSELQASEEQLQELQDAAHTKTLELEVCENELQRKRNEAELLREKAGRLSQEAASLREAAVAAAAGSRHGLGRCHEPDDPCLLPESDEAKAQRQGADALQGLKQQAERLRGELLYERRRSEEQLENFEDERRTWYEEKEKVIRYQKQLQHNYIQMYRRNRELERDVRQLTLELEARELDELDLHGAEIQFEEITATEI